jgi:hypothetical protein
VVNEELHAFTGQCLGRLTEQVAEHVSYSLVELELELNLPDDAKEVHADADLADACRVLIRNSLIEEELGNSLAVAVARKIKELALRGDVGSEAELRRGFERSVDRVPYDG